MSRAEETEWLCARTTHRRAVVRLVAAAQAFDAAPIGEDGWLRFCAAHAAFVTGDDLFEDPQATLEPDDGYPWLQGVR